MTTCLIMYSHGPPSSSHLSRLSKWLSAPPLVASSESEAIAFAPQAKIILGHRYLRQSLPYTNQLCWVQSTAGGIDHLVCPDLQRLQPLLTSCPIFAKEVAWHALALAMALNRDLFTKPHSQVGTISKQAMILGMGNIGHALGRLLKGMGLQVKAVQHQSPIAIDCCTEVILLQNWQEHLFDVDWLFLALPLTAATFHLVNAAAFKRLPPHASLINVGRGATLDTLALLEWLKQNPLGRASVDVIEPLPVDWDAVPRLWHTPLTATYCPDRQTRLEAFIETQVAAFVQDQPLQAVVPYTTLYSPEWDCPR